MPDTPDPPPEADWLDEFLEACAELADRRVLEAMPEMEPQ